MLDEQQQLGVYQSGLRFSDQQTPLLHGVSSSRV